MPGFSMSFKKPVGSAANPLAAGAATTAGPGGSVPSNAAPKKKALAPVLDCFKEEDGPKRRPLFLLSEEEAPKPTQVASSDAPDSLDAFMATITADSTKASDAPKTEKATWEEAEDHNASFIESFEKEKGKGTKKPKATGADALMASDDEDEGAEDDDDDDENQDRRSKPIEPLPAVDHSAMEYATVRTEFYTPHEDIKALTQDEVTDLRKSLRITATGSNCPHPVVSFAHLGLPAELMQGIRKHGYTKPTPIQAQAIPAALCGRDVIGIAETGSGKTLAYMMPMLVHCAAQPPLQKDEGPIALTLSPTRELAVQIEKEAYKFNKLFGLRSTTLAGGLSKFQQFKEVKKGSEVIIATPGRLIDIVKMKGCNLRRCTFLVLDEADRMLHMGFEPQIRSIAQNIRPSRQTLFFSATFPPKIEKISSDLLINPVRITVGKLGQAAVTVTQRVEVVSSEDAKWQWFGKHVESMLSKGQLLVFTQSKQKVEEIKEKLTDILHQQVLTLHGDLSQDERMSIMDTYRKRKAEVLVATDLAARGLDVPTIRTVVSFDAARDIQTHTHRVGRTGRAGQSGEAFTLLLLEDPKNRRMAGQLVDHLEVVGQPVNQDLLDLALRHAPYRAQRTLQSKRKGAPSAAAAAVAAAMSLAEAAALAGVHIPADDAGDDVDDGDSDDSDDDDGPARKRARSSSPAPPTP
mmetsp:Transcript_640/g.1297  ORF Transcript_640/g.1297 Transcript_640/m.1297 type:complete len:692 (+) Transcript_640:95-2170(+)